MAVKLIASIFKPVQSKTLNVFNPSAASYVMKTGGRLPGDKAARA